MIAETRAARARLAAALFPPAPAERLAGVRILVGLFAVVYLAARAPHLANVARFPASAFAPVGPVALLPAPLAVWAVWALVVAAIAAACAFVVGWRHRLTGPAFAGLLLWVTSYRSSWGMIFHTENLLVLHALALAAAPAADAWSVDARRAPARARDPGLYGGTLRLMGALTAATYVIAGVSKLRLTGSAWITGEVLATQIAFDNLRKAESGSIYSPLVALVLPHGWVFPALAALTLLVELGAPIALLGGRVALAWTAAAWGFHVGVIALMAIVFPYPLALVAYAPFFAVERPLAGLAAWARSRRRRDEG